MAQREIPANFLVQSLREDKYVNSGFQKPRVVVDATHPRFLREIDRAPNSVSVSTDDNFCKQCKTVFINSTEAIRYHFRSIMHNSSLSCIYCGGVVYEYFYGDEIHYAHDCDPKARRILGYRSIKQLLSEGGHGVDEKVTK